MKSPNYPEIVLRLEPKISSIINTLTLLDKKLRQGDDPNPHGYPIEAAIETITKTILDWMGQFKIKDLRQFLEKTKYWQDINSPVPELTKHINSLENMIAVFLKTGNVAKSAACLSGPDREKLLMILVKADKYTHPWGLPVSAAGIATKYLNKLACADLIEKFSGGLIRITWQGTTILRHAGIQPRDHPETGEPEPG